MKNIIPQKKRLLESVSTGGGNLFASYLKDATTRIYRYKQDGTGEQAKSNCLTSAAPVASVVSVTLRSASTASAASPDRAPSSSMTTPLVRARSSAVPT